MQQDDKTDWLPISDLMSGLMLIFMLIAILFARSIINKKQDDTAQCNKIYTALYNAFENDFKIWNAELKNDLTVRFNTYQDITYETPRVLFAKGESAITPYFQNILQQFYPKYITILKQQHDTGNTIQSLRIEGHTSSVWGDLSPQSAYFANMKLSQDRARKILQFVLEDSMRHSKHKAWTQKLTTANGLSSNKILYTDGVEDKNRSRRVEFKAIASSCQRAGINDDG